MADSPPSTGAMPTHIDCDCLLAEPGIEPAARQMRIALASGHVADIAPLPMGTSTSTGRRLALPALSNAHDHARTFRTSTVGASNMPLESWISLIGAVPGLDPYLCAATSFARSAKRGVANLMVHYTRAQGGMPYVDEARAVARAARDVGVRIGFAVAMRDRHGIAYCDDETVVAALRPVIRDEVLLRLSVKPVSPTEQLAVVHDVAEMVGEDGYGDFVDVQYGPTAVHWCSTPLLEAIARASSETGRRVHMHLLETMFQREWADKAHPQGIVSFLDSIGLLSPRLTVAHCVWARPSELALLAERGVTIAVNSSSNLGLKSGIAPLAEMFRQGCRVAMGLDGMALDEDDDALRELRLAWLLHRGWGYSDTFEASRLWRFVAGHGHRSTGGRASEHLAGTILAGAPADILLLDWDAIDDESLYDDIDPLQQLLSRANGSHVDKLLVGGRLVVDGGRVTGVDEKSLNAEMLGAARSALARDPAHLHWRATLKALAEDLGPFYGRHGLDGCC